MLNVQDLPGVVGDGVHDDTPALQAALDTHAATVYLPAPRVAYLLRGPLRIHSRQTLLLDRYAVVRLADHAHAYMLTNADPVNGNHEISVIGGIWDGNNAHQTCEYHTNGYNWRPPFDPARYLGVLMQFQRVTDLRVAHLTYKDPETFGFQGARLRRFTIEDITFDYNLLRANMDGIHIHGHSHEGRITNLKGTTNDDLVALNADDAPMYELCGGPITDIQVDGLWSTDGYTAVRLLSAGSPIQRVTLSNIHGTYRYHVVSFTNHNVHPGTASTFDDITIQGVYVAKSMCRMPAATPGQDHGYMAPIWLAAPAQVSRLTLRDFHRTESARPAPSICVDPGVTIQHLVLDNVSLVNACAAPVQVLDNRGSIARLALQHVAATAAVPGASGAVVHNTGTISHVDAFAVSGNGYATGV